MTPWLLAIAMIQAEPDARIVADPTSWDDIGAIVSLCRRFSREDHAVSLMAYAKRHRLTGPEIKQLSRDCLTVSIADLTNKK